MTAAQALPTVASDGHAVTGKGTEMTTTELAGLAELKQSTRAIWAAGDYPAVAKRTLWEVGERLVRRVGAGKDEDVLDVGCGTGNVAIRAAQAGGQVVGLDLTPELFEAGQRLAGEAGVTIEWVEGDAEALPFEDESFDVVLSAFGCMFAPRHQVTAGEMARVLRPGGRVGVCTWSPRGIQGDFFRALAAHAPPLPDFAEPPLLWGSEDHVRGLFAGTGVQLEFDRDTVQEQPFGSGDDAVDFLATNFGPMMMLRGLLESKGVWEDLRAQLAKIYDRREPAEYLLVLGRKPYRPRPKAASLEPVTWDLRESGPPDAEHAAFLLPGGMCTAAFYEEVMAEPKLAGIRLVAATMPGHGGTPAPQDASVENCARLAGELAAGRGCDVVVGHSMGANVALEMAASGEFSGPLVLLAPSFSRQDESVFLRVLDRLGRVLGHLPFAAMLKLIGVAVKGSPLPADRRAALAVELRKNDPRFVRRGVHCYLRYLDRYGSVAARLCKAGVPAWVVHGERGDGGITDEERRTLEACPRVSVITIPGASYFTPTEEPALVAELIVKALEQTC
jgi:SAM-dependent methyltransferase